VLGSGPGGYAAAFRAADLGLRVTLVERYPTLGGVCLNVGCIPSKALLHAARVIEETREMKSHGLDFGDPDIDLDNLRAWKQGVVSRLTGGLEQLATRRKVEVVTGTGRFVDAHSLEVLAPEGESRTLTFGSAVIAAGSSAVELPFLPHDDPRVMTSTGALEIADVPARLLVIGGGIIGLEMATVYNALGSRITIVEMMDRLMVGADKDIVRPLAKRLTERYEKILLETRVTAAEATGEGIVVQFDGKDAPQRDVFDRVLVAVGRCPNGRNIGAEAAGVVVDEHGFIPSDLQQRTNVAHIFSIGDIKGQPMLAHKATHEGKVAAEVIAGLKSGFDAAVIPNVAYTDPEVAWVGLTEEQAREQGIEYEKGSFPWAASGRSLAIGRDEGMTKLLFDPSDERVLGGAVVGPGAGELIAEIGLAIEMGSDARDIGLTVHAHPTLSETVGMAAEAFEGTLTDLYLPRRGGKKRSG
jgi:dihydrolipoamide dehydrogenase